MVKLVIQPLVENAIYHSIKYMEEKGCIQIIGKAENGVICIDVRDNGVGMEPEVLEHILEPKPVEPGKKRRGVGVFNVQKPAAASLWKRIRADLRKLERKRHSGTYPGSVDQRRERRKRMSGKKNKAVWLVAGMGVLFVLLTGILYVGAKTKGPVRLVYIPKVIDDENDFWKFLLEGVQMAAEESGAEVTIMAGKNETDVQGQIVKIREAISLQPDAILLSPISYTTVTEAVREIKEAGIRLVLVDSTLDEEIQDAAVRTDNVHAGEKVERQVSEKIKPERPVIGLVLHVEGSSTAIEREAGFRNAIGEYADCIVDTVYTDSDYEKGYEVTSLEASGQHPDINVVVGGNEYLCRWERREL